MSTNWGQGHPDKLEPEFEVPRFLAPYEESAEFFDPDLAELANNLNALIRATHERRRRPELQLGLLILDDGFLPVWKRVIDRDDFPANYVDVDALVHLDDLDPDEIAAALKFTRR